MSLICITASFTDVADDLKARIEAASPGKRVAFIATASLVESVTFYVDEARTWFLEHGFSISDIDVLAKSQEQLHDDIRGCDIIYVTGGNTFYLLQELKRKNLLALIQNCIQNGMPYIGESAGSMILSKDIQYASHMDDASQAPLLENPQALGAIDFYPVVHYKNEPFSDAADTIIQTYGKSLPLETISNHQAMIVMDSKTYRIDAVK